MAVTEDLIDFNVIEDSKENIQTLPSGRSAKGLASVFSPLAIKSPSSTQDLNDAAREEFEKELQNIEESDDPLDTYDRYCKWTLNAYPSAQATPQAQLLSLLERATKAFLSSAHYKNDPRYLKLWLNYIRFFSDAPRETFAYLSRHNIGDGLALYYEEFAAWLETAGRWSQAEEVYKMGLEKEARPVERLLRKFGEFEKRLEAQSKDAKEPTSPAFPAVRPALAAKTVPFSDASPSPRDPQMQPQARRVAPSNTKEKRLEVFSDAGSESRPVTGNCARRWENIGTLAERRKENEVSANPWAGETMKSAKPASVAPKMMVFKDPSMAHIPIPGVINRPSLDQKVVNSRNGKIECVAVNLEAVYPDPPNPDIEFCFEELRAANRGWLKRDWRQPTSLAQRSPIKSRTPLTESPCKELNARADDFEIAITKSHAPKTVLLNDENDENAGPLTNSPALKYTPGPKLRKQDDNKTREIRVQKSKSETQTIQTNLDSPRGPRIRRKKSSEPTATVTVHTKAARDEIYDIFNQPLDAKDVTEDVDGGMSSDDDYTSAGESTGTGHISATTSDFDEEHTDADLIEVQSAADTEESGNNTDWTEFDAQKDIPGKDQEDDEEQSTAEQTRSREPELLPNRSDTAREEEMATPASPEVHTENKRTFMIPLPPDDIEAPKLPYRDAAQVAKSRLPFMTPIAEQTESSLGTATAHKDRDYFSIKTPCPKGGQKTPVIPESDGEPLSSPFQDVLQEAINNQHPIPQPKLEESPSIPASRMKPLKDAAPKGSIIKDTQCNPMDGQIRRMILQEMHPPLASFKGYFDRSHKVSNRRGDIRKYCKAAAVSKASRGANDRLSHAVQPSPVLALDGAERQLSIKRELGSGAFAPVYLAEETQDESDESEDAASFGAVGRHRPEAVKMEYLPSPWEFYIIRSAKRRLGVSRAADSIIDAYEMHLFQDECFLIEEYRDQGTLLDLVNTSVREAAAAGGSGSMDEMLAMFFAVELFRTVEGLHSKGIIHGDLKPDNVLVRFDDPNTVSSCEELASQYERSGAGGWSAKGLALIDFGRGIDMRAFQSGVQFIADWETSPTDCAEMRELRPWTFQADYHGMAAIIHVMLFGKYIDTTADKGGALGAGATKTYRLRESLKRYWQTDVWSDVFRLLLNSGRAAESEEGGRLPALRSLKGVRERMEQWLEQNCEKGVGLRNLVKKAEGLASARKKA